MMMSLWTPVTFIALAIVFHDFLALVELVVDLPGLFDVDIGFSFT